VDVLSVVRARPVRQEADVTGAERKNDRDEETAGVCAVPSIRLEIKYSSGDRSGKCVQCLAEQELNACLRDLLTDNCEDNHLEEKFAMLVRFLESPDLRRLRVESERHLAEGKRVFLRLESVDGNPEFKLEVSQ
jgi:hypothetical protein